MLSGSLISGLSTSEAVRVTGAGRPAENHTVAAVVTDADTSITALNIAIDGSLDGTNYYELANHDFSAGELTALAAMFHTVNKPVNYIKVRVASHTGAAAGDLITILYEPNYGG